MSFVTIIRDYVDLVNNLSESFTGVIPIVALIKETSIYLLKTIQYSFLYFITFQWLHDFTLLPVTIPQITSSLLREKFFLEESVNPFFSFLEIQNFGQNNFILGLLNSIFLTFPTSIIHILTIRRLFIKGIPAATFSISGYIIGQLFFILLVVFGCRDFINAWFTLEPLNYILGLVLIFKLVYNMTQENLRELTGWNQPQYRNFFILSFILAWCEQSSVFQYLGNLSLNPESSLLEISSNTNTFSTFFEHTLYIVGLIIGSVFFTVCWGFILLQIKNLFIQYTPLFLSSFIQTVNTGSFILAVALSLSSIPFYGLDYLITRPLGFVSQDQVFKNTVFDQYNIKDSVLGLGISSQYASVDIDVTPFDRGRYLIFPERTMPFAFEDLNYRGESEWTTRYDKVSTVTDSRAGFLSLAKIFKKQKTEENVGNRRQLEENKNVLSIKSKFKTDSSLDNYQIGLENKEARFQDWYTLDPDISADDGRPLESIFAEIQDTTFPLDFNRTTSVEPGNIDLKIKQKYYSNPIYQNLLALDIDLFLNRQSNKSKLNGTQELDLYNRRRVLTSYYDSLRDYAQLPYTTEFSSFFNGAKSFTNKVYNQQFKGTLRSVCRLFSLTTDLNSNLETDKTVLKYDQPLYTFGKIGKFSSYHEEVPLNSIQSPFIEDIVSGPLYAGWDEKLRKFVITNKYLPRTLAGYKTSLNPELQNKLNQSKNNKETSQQVYRIKFTVWPLNPKIINQGKTESSIPFTTLYTSKSDFGTSGDPTFDNLSNLPNNWETRNRRSNIGLGKTYDNIFDYLAPQKGGFIWPGNQKISFKIGQ
jgi:hypothetical protein